MTRALFLVLTTAILISTIGYSQQVGLVLSGGGANGFAHIGVLRALEENNIPIDYITGTSSGAFVGAMYASGYTVDEIEAFLISEEFMRLIQGDLEPEEEYFFKKKEPDASMVTLRISKDFSLTNSLPTNLLSTSKIDLDMMELFSTASQAANYNFDSLMIPLRCVAADVDAKEEYIFEDGNLSTAVRASFTYPFLIKPIEVDGKLLFDGGLYNNFPHDIMTNTFSPDFIVGVKVTSNEPPPKSNNLISQLRTMMISKTDFELKSPGMIIEPQTNQGSLEFKNLEALIDSGYQATLRQIPQLKEKIKSRQSPEERLAMRQAFKAKQEKVVFGAMEIEGLSKKQSKYARKHLWPKKKDSVMDLQFTRKNFYKLNADERIESLYPTSRYDSSSGMYQYKVKVNRQKPFSFDFGGNISNRPINTGFVQIAYQPLWNPSFKFLVNTYFGRFYNSVKVAARTDFAGRHPFSLEGTFIMNSWNYFTSKSFFFDDEKPSYLIKNEIYGLLEFHIPIDRTGQLTFLGSYTRLRDQYYQTQSFDSKDVPDVTTTTPVVLGFKYRYNTQNRTMYASSGHLVNFNGFYANGNEETVPGTTARDQTITNTDHEWIKARFNFDSFYKGKGFLRLGVTGDFVYSNQSLFNNYTASILRSPSFEPIPESRTLFLESFRAYQYASLGHKFVFNVWKGIDLRAEGYLFAPYDKVVRDADGVQQKEVGFNQLYSILTGGAVYNSPVGPLSVSVNYYFNAPEVNPANEPITFLFHFGYILFNKRSLD